MPLSFRGDTLLISGQVPDDLGPAACVLLDFDLDGRFECRVTAGDDGVYAVSVGASQLSPEGVLTRVLASAGGERQSEPERLHLARTDDVNPAASVPRRRLSDLPDAPEPAICLCADCPPEGMLSGRSLDSFTSSNTPAFEGIELATGKIRRSFPLFAFDTRRLGFGMTLHHASLIDYDGPAGRSISHSFNMMIVRSGPRSGRIVTPDLRIFPIASEDGVHWKLPSGFFSRLTLDESRRRWTLIHFSGLEVQLYEGAPDRPGYPLSIRDPNGNCTRLSYDESGALRGIRTDLDQRIGLAYGSDGRLASVTDHIGRIWTFQHDNGHRLVRIGTPITTYADIAVGQEITGADLPEVMVSRPRTTVLAYDVQYGDHLSSITDGRGATPIAWHYDDLGRVDRVRINGHDARILYEPETSPPPRPKLEASNLVRRVIDREGNITDFEIHGEAGGPVDGKGRYGLRRTVTWSERGLGRPALRPEDPSWWEQRWLYTCHCLVPQTATQPFTDLDAAQLAFDANGIPTAWPRHIHTFNRNRQVLRHEYTDGTRTIVVESTYQDEGFGIAGQYSRLATQTDPRAFDANPIYAGLEFVHTFEYDPRGNLIRHVAPTITRGVDDPQIVAESWEHNAQGQLTVYIDPNGNLTTYAYRDGYLESITQGASGSRDAETSLTTMFEVNAIGLVTRCISPMSHVHQYTYNDLAELVKTVEPAVTLRSGARVQYETHSIYDGGGLLVLDRRLNLDVDGKVLPGEFIDRSIRYDVLGNGLSERVAVDDDRNHDLVTTLAYDQNDDLIVVRRPEGDREFRVPDERRLTFKTFLGVSPAASILEGYPVDRRTDSLAGAMFVGMTIDSYDSRANRVRTRDARGKETHFVHDFYNRMVAVSDPNGNGWVRTYDAASLVTAEAHGRVSSAGLLLELLSRTYYRYDMLGRLYQRVCDAHLGPDRSSLVDPDDGSSPMFTLQVDAGSRPVLERDPNGNTAVRKYDAADRLLGAADALGNGEIREYDADSNVVRLTQIEVSGAGGAAAPEAYVTTYAYDELGRCVEGRVRGLNGHSVDHPSFFAYDSRHNVRLTQDAAGRVVLNQFDYHGRKTGVQWFDGDPIAGAARELFRYTFTYDRNGRRIREQVLSDLNDPLSAQVTRHEYDPCDRATAVVYPGRTDGRREMTFDENSNLIAVTDGRGIVLRNVYDAGNRLIEQRVVAPGPAAGVTRQTFKYDALNRLVLARNNYAQVRRKYDALSRPVRETQSIRVDGRGYAAGWQHPVTVAWRYDKASNRTGLRVLNGKTGELGVTTVFDSLNRAVELRASYFDRADHRVAKLSYAGPSRAGRMMLGNGVACTSQYDAKRRLRALAWTPPSGAAIAAVEYAYDSVDYVQYERHLHDRGRYDQFQYNRRHELAGASYRTGSAASGAAPQERFTYDDAMNRRTARVSSPGAGGSATEYQYAVDAANAYSRIARGPLAYQASYDEAGNPTSFPLRPVAPSGDRQEVTADATWDAFNRPVTLDPQLNPRQLYFYDPLGRRVAVEEEGASHGGRRFIYDGWETVAVRRFLQAPSTDGASRLERVYVTGSDLDRPVLAALDRDGDGRLGAVLPKNGRDERADQEYYFLTGRIGNVVGLVDADHPTRVLEYYRFSAFGDAAVFEGLGTGGSMSPFDAAPRHHAPESGNTILFTGREFDERTGLYYYRHRYYEPTHGRFLSCDPLGYTAGLNLYAYALNNPVNFTDPLGLQDCTGLAEPPVLRPRPAPVPPFRPPVSPGTPRSPFPGTPGRLPPTPPVPRRIPLPRVFAGAVLEALIIAEFAIEVGKRIGWCCCAWSLQDHTAWEPVPQGSGIGTVRLRYLRIYLKSVLAFAGWCRPTLGTHTFPPRAVATFRSGDAYVSQWDDIIRGNPNHPMRDPTMYELKGIKQLLGGEGAKVACIPNTYCFEGEYWPTLIGYELNPGGFRPLK